MDSHPIIDMVVYRMRLFPSTKRIRMRGECPAFRHYPNAGSWVKDLQITLLQGENDVRKGTWLQLRQPHKPTQQLCRLTRAIGETQVELCHLHTCNVAHVGDPGRDTQDRTRTRSGRSR